VADGHHRSAAAARAAEKRRAESSRPRDDRAYEWLLSVLVPAAQLRIRPYNRVVRDVGGRSSQALLAELSTCGTVRPASDPVPPEPGIFCFYLERRWWRLDLPGGSIDRSDPVGSLDVRCCRSGCWGRCSASSISAPIPASTSWADPGHPGPRGPG
jgi:uncharacterized protein (DUF1015 family)